MKKILAFAGSNSKTSINAQLIDCVAETIQAASVKTIQLTSFDIPMYDIDTENQKGIPIDVQLLKTEIQKNEGLIISLNEHNGSVSAFMKNILDWLSRADRNYLDGKKLLLMSTSPGAGGAAHALKYGQAYFPRVGGTIAESFSFPSFQSNFDTASKTITNPTLKMGVDEVIASFLQQLEA